MTRDQIIANVLSRLGERGKDVRLQQASVTELANIQRDRLEQADFKPWFILSDLEYTTTTAGDQRIALPTYFLEEYEEGSLLWRQDVGYAWVPLVKGNLDQTQGYRRLTGFPPGVARSYSLVGLNFILETPPVTPYQLAMLYYKAEPTIMDPYLVPGDVTTNKWMTYAPEWMMCELGALLAAYHVRDPDAGWCFPTGRGQSQGPHLHSTHRPG